MNHSELVYSTWTCLFTVTCFTRRLKFSKYPDTMSLAFIITPGDFFTVSPNLHSSFPSLAFLPLSILVFSLLSQHALLSCALLSSPLFFPCSGGEVDLEAFLQGSVWYVWYIRLLFCPTIYQTYSYSVLLCLQTCVCSVYDLFMNVCVFGASDGSICLGGMQGCVLGPLELCRFLWHCWFWTVWT